MELTRELIKKAQTGDKKARDKLVMDNLGLVYNVALRFNHRGTDIEDFRQIGIIGLIKAIDRFDTNQEVKFSTYAVPLIIGEIKRFIRDDGIIKISRKVKENAWEIKKFINEYEMKTGESPSVKEIICGTGLEYEEVTAALGAGAEVESIYKTNNTQEGEIEIIDKISNQNGIRTGISDREIEDFFDSEYIKALMNELDETSVKLIRLRYVFEYTQARTAKELGLSQVKVSRMEKKILGKLKEAR